MVEFLVPEQNCPPLAPARFLAGLERDRPGWQRPGGQRRLSTQRLLKLSECLSLKHWGSSPGVQCLRVSLP
eukprot:324809-Pyramimonas_sp.AAC.1